METVVAMPPPSQDCGQYQMMKYTQKYLGQYKIQPKSTNYYKWLFDNLVVETYF